MKLFSLDLDPEQATRSLLALIFVGVGLLLTFLLGQISTLTCNRVDDADRCVLRVNWMGIAPLRETRIEGLQGAQVDESCDEDGCTYRVVLLTAIKNLPLETAYSSGRAEKEETAAKIDTFVNNRQIATLEVATGGGLWLIIPAVFIVVGISMTITPLTHALRSLFIRE